jgi:hypothetical protein
MVFVELACIVTQSSWYCCSCDQNSVPYILLILKVSMLTLNCDYFSNCYSVFVFFLPLRLGACMSWFVVRTAVCVTHLSDHLSIPFLLELSILQQNQ